MSLISTVGINTINESCSNKFIGHLKTDAELPQRMGYCSNAVCTHPDVHHNRGWPFLDLKWVVEWPFSITPAAMMVLLHFRLTGHFTKSLFFGQLLTKIWKNTILIFLKAA
jgi:hypothetical protein